RTLPSVPRIGRGSRASMPSCRKAEHEWPLWRAEPITLASASRATKIGTAGAKRRAMKKQVVIIGGGFGGLRAARALKSAPVDVTLIDRRNHHIFQPLLYQVATGSLAAGEVAAPLRSIFRRQKNARVLLGEVVDFDPAARKVVLADGAAFPYDALIVAAGTQSSYYGHEEWREWAPSLKSVEE